MTAATKLNPLYIFDLDGTLALTDHRQRVLTDGLLPNKDKWRIFFEMCVDDAPNKPVIEVFNTLLNTTSDFLIFSGRSDAVRRQTVDWVVKHTRMGTRECDSVLTMRKEGDFTPDDVLKRQWYDALTDFDKARLVAVFDDRDKVVKMWRDLGVACFQVAPGKF